MLEEYRKHVAERAAMGIVAKPLDATQMAALVELLKNPPAGEEEFLLDLLINRVPPGVDEAAYVKAGFLAAIAKGEATSPLVTPEKAVELLGTMQGGYNIHPLIDALDDAKLAPIAAKALSHTLLMFDNFYDVEEKAKAGNEYAKQVMQSWADAEWFLNRPALAEKLTVTVFKVTGETNTDDLSPAPDAWSRPDIPLHALAMLKNAWRGDLRRLLALNRDIMLRSLLLQLCFGALTVFGARLGSDIVAVNAVLMTMLTFTAYALDGFAYAVEAHSGQAYGARDGSQLLDVWRAACRQSGIVALLFSVVYLLAGEHIIALLTSLTQIQQLADRYLIWQVILPVVGVWCYLLDGMFIGATRGAEMRNSMAVAAAGFAVTLLTLPVLGNHGLWLALAVFLALRGLSLALIWRRHWRRGTWFS